MNRRQFLLIGSLRIDEPLTSEYQHFREATSKNHDLNYVLHAKAVQSSTKEQEIHSQWKMLDSNRNKPNVRSAFSPLLFPRPPVGNEALTLPMGCV